MAKRSRILDMPEYKCSMLFFICLAGVLSFIFLGIIPANKYVADLHRKIQNVQLQVDIQETLLPIYQLLKEDFLADDYKTLPFPEKARLSKEQSDKAFVIFREMAKKFNMEVLSIVPDLKALYVDSQFLLVNTVLHGEFFNFRKLLLALGEIPFLEHIEAIEIQQKPETKEFKIDFWIAIS